MASEAHNIGVTQLLLRFAVALARQSDSYILFESILVVTANYVFSAAAAVRKACSTASVATDHFGATVPLWRRDGTSQ